MTSRLFVLVAWKYGERGFRHLYWDAGTMLANLLAVEPSADVRVGFVDEAVAALVGIDRVSEFPLALVVLHGSDRGNDGGAADAGAVEPLDEPSERQVEPRAPPQQIERLVPSRRH